MRVLLLAMLAACAAPALAQTCKITRIEAGLTTAASIKVDGATTKLLVLDTGPILASMKIDPDAKAKGYAVDKGSKASFYWFRDVLNVSAADWAKPDKIFTNDAGFAVEWPHVLLKGKSLEWVGLEIAIGAKVNTWKLKQAPGSSRKGIALVPPMGIESPHGFIELGLGGGDVDEDWDVWVEWRDALEKRGPLVATFTDAATKQKIAVATFTPLTAVAAQARVAKDVNALRKAVEEKRCQPS